MSATPETDAATHDLSDYGSPVLCSWGDWVDADFARKLERERDEAREQIKELIYIGERSIALAEIDLENDKFGIVSELRAELDQIKESEE
jgi:hypothetical protein